MAEDDCLTVQCRGEVSLCCQIIRSATPSFFFLFFSRLVQIYSDQDLLILLSFSFSFRFFRNNRREFSFFFISCREKEHSA